MTSDTENAFAAMHESLDQIDSERDTSVKLAIKSCRNRRMKRASQYNKPGIKQVLIVDDEELLVRTYKRAVREVADIVDVALSLREATERVQERSYDLLVVDYLLVDGDASEFIRRVRALPDKQRASVYVLLISGKPGLSRTDALEIGANDFLAKPFSMLTLQGEIKKAFAATVDVQG